MRTQPAQRPPAPATPVGKSPVSRTVTPVGRFLAEPGGMYVAMCAGGILGSASSQAASGHGFPVDRYRSHRAVGCGRAADRGQVLPVEADRGMRQEHAYWIGPARRPR